MKSVLMAVLLAVACASSADAQRIARAAFTQASGEHGIHVAMMAEQGGPPSVVVHVVYGALVGIAVAAVASGVIAATVEFDEYGPPATMLVPLALAAGAAAGGVVGFVVYIVRGSGTPDASVATDGAERGQRFHSNMEVP